MDFVMSATPGGVPHAPVPTPINNHVEQTASRIVPSKDEKVLFDNITFDEINALTDVKKLHRMERYMRQEGFEPTANAIKARMIVLGADKAKIEPLGPEARKVMDNVLDDARLDILNWTSEVKERDEQLVAADAGNASLPVRNARTAQAPAPAAASEETTTTTSSSTVVGKKLTAEEKRRNRDQGDVRSGRAYYDRWDRYAEDEEAEEEEEKKVEEQKARDFLSGKNKPADNAEASGAGDEHELVRRLRLYNGATDAERAFAAAREKDKGNELFRAREYTAAIDAFSLSLALHPNNSAVHSNRAAAYLKVKRYDDVIEDCTNAIKCADDAFNSNPASTMKVYMRRGTACTELKRYEEAVDDFDKASEYAEAAGNEKAGRDIQESRIKAARYIEREKERKSVPEKTTRVMIEEVDDEDEDDDDDEDGGDPSAAQEGGEFLASKSFAGARKGYAFRTGKQGLGYYRDPVQKGVVAAAPSPAPEPVQDPAAVALDSATKMKVAANDKFKKRDYGGARKGYSEAIEILETTKTKEAKDALAVLYCNRSNCQFHLRMYDAAVSDATQAMCASPDTPKAYLRRAVALVEMKKYKDAMADYQELLSLSQRLGGAVEKEYATTARQQIAMLKGKS